MATLQFSTNRGAILQSINYENIHIHRTEEKRKKAIERKKGRMEKKMMMAVGLAVLVIISCNTVVVESDASDCYDACSTACVNSDPRLSARCNRKCEIRCGPAYKANGHLD